MLYGHTQGRVKKIAEMWNQHIIASSKSSNENGPRGRPDVIYFLPHLFDAEDCKQQTDRDEVNEFYDNSTMLVKDFSNEFGEFALVVMRELGLAKPTNVKEAFDLHIALLERVENF